MAAYLRAAFDSCELINDVSDADHQKLMNKINFEERFGKLTRRADSVLDMDHI